MSSNRESAVLIVTLLATLGIVGGGLWWIKEYLRFSSETTLTSSTPTNTPLNCQVPNAPPGLFNYGGSTTWAAIRKETEPLIAQACPHFRLRYIDPINQAPSSQAGVEMLIEDQLAFAQSSQSLTPENHRQAQARGFQLQEVPVAIDAITVGVHPQQQISQLTLNQLRDIYSGKVTNWKQLGGANLKITPYSRPLESGGTVKFFKNNILQRYNFSNQVKLVRSTTLAIRQLAQDKGGIYYASASEMVKQCGVKSLALANNTRQFVSPYQTPFVNTANCPQKRNQINKIAFRNGAYPITRRLFAIVKLNGQTDEQAGKAYAQWMLSPQGQKSIEKAGFVPVN